MKTIKTTIYECEYCKKYYKRKHACIKHEMQCYNNPNNFHACYDCSHLEVWRDENNGKQFFCDKYEKYMHTCKAEARGFAEKLGTQRMPLECEGKEISCEF